jgi:hypothetical protein
MVNNTPVMKLTVRQMNNDSIPSSRMCGRRKCNGSEKEDQPIQTCGVRKASWRK